MASKTLSTAAEVVFPRNNNRKSFVIHNEDATDSVFVKRERTETPTVSATDHDLKIGPGSSVSLNSLVDGKAAITDRWTAIASANTPRIGYFETEEFER